MNETKENLKPCQARSAYQAPAGPRPPARPGPGCPAGGVKARPSPWIYSHTGTESCLRVYEKGIEQVGYQAITPKKGSSGAGRGEITGLSLKSSGRLRRYLTQNSRSECQIYGVSLTLPGAHDAGLWEGMAKRLRNDAIRAGVSYVWRIELQRRKVPHFHLVAWVPNGSKGHRIFTENWIEYLPLERRNMKGVSRHCVDLRPMKENSVEWYAYLVAHAYKKKKSQLGWKGKQWGIVGRKFMQRIKPESFKFSHTQRLFFDRTLRKMIIKSGHNCRAFHPWRGYTRIINPGRVKPLIDWITKHVE